MAQGQPIMGLINLQGPLSGLHIRRQAPPVPATRGYVTVRRTGAIGDALAATVVVKKLQNLGFNVIYQAGSPCHCVLRRVPVVRQLAEPNGHAMIDLDGAYEQHPQRSKLHFAEMFVEAANRQLNGMATIADARNFSPRMVLSEQDVEQAMKVMGAYPKPWVAICPRSNSYPQRTIPDHVWHDAASMIKGTCFWLGTHTAPHHANIIDLRVRHVDTLIGFLGVADLMVGVDSGPAHLSAAIGTPMVVAEQQSSPTRHFSNQRDFTVIRPSIYGEELTCLNCVKETCPLDAKHPPCQLVPATVIADAVNARLQCVTDNGISAVIVIHRPPDERLNRCLTHVLPQVDEVVIVSDTAGLVPDGAMQDARIRYVQLNQHDTGYSRKLNFGVRHTNNRFLWFGNDDVFLEPDAIERMCDVMEWDVGMVGMEMRYPDGTLQHAGKHRPLGHWGWGHTSHRQRVSPYTNPLEMENVCGASILVRREAFYQAGGYDEDVHLYSEDDLASLRFRQAGWKIIYTPHGKSVHIEHASTDSLPNIGEQCAKSDAIVRAKWGWWFQMNQHREGLGVFE